MRAFLDHTKCLPSAVEHIATSSGSSPNGFFGFDGLKLYGRTSQGPTCPVYSDDLPDVHTAVSDRSGSITLPFSPSEVIDNLRLERYVSAMKRSSASLSDHESAFRSVYYALRPLLPVSVRSILQRIALSKCTKIPFPAWPVDMTVEGLIEALWVLALRFSEHTQIPFIWYWPKGFKSCAIMTHDVETSAGQDLCLALLALDQEYGIRSSYEFIPEVRYEISEDIVGSIQQAGGEICIHGLNHDGRLFSSETEFRTRAKAINQHAQKWGARGFRSPIMYRNENWYDALGFSYDMSVPNVAHLDPQHGGCCTVFPYFCGDVLELPLTTTQDYSLYNILRSDPIAMWTAQIDAILAKGGLMSFIIHPDYTMNSKKQDLYRRLLQMLKQCGEKRDVWLALPGEVDSWWRARNSMTLAREGGTWTVQGTGSERATVACATLKDGKLAYVFQNEYANVS